MTKKSSDKELKKEPLKSTTKNLDVKKCMRCGRLFKDDGYNSNLCPSCITLDNDDFEKVRLYLYDHTTATAIELSEETGVSIVQIERYLKNGRLEIPEGSPIFIKCEKCGTDIRSGRLCSMCSLSLSNAMRMDMNFTDSQIGETPKKKGGSMKDGKMYYFNNK